MITALKFLAVMAIGMAIPLGLMWFCMEVAPDLAGAARMAFRVVRVLFLAVGWAVLVVRLLL